MNLRICLLQDGFCFGKEEKGEDERGPRGGDEKNVARQNTLSVENDARLSVAAYLPIMTLAWFERTCLVSLSFQIFCERRNL